MNRLGKTGLEVMPIGFGGIVVMDAEPSQASKAVSDAVEFGINYFDVAPAYGNAEVILGPALKPFRKDVYLACKTEMRDAKGAKATLDQSLKNLQTDYFDVFQLHALTDVEKDVKAAMAKGGAMEVLLDAKKAGVIRHIGFSAHSPEAAIAAMNMFDFETVMYPINFVMNFKKQFQTAVIEEARNRDMGIIALKTLAKQKRPEKQSKYTKCWYQPIDDIEIAELAMCWTLNQGASIAISPGEEDLLRMMMKIYPRLRNLKEEELKTLENYAQSQIPFF